MLELKNLNKIYKVNDDDLDVKEVHAVKDISLTFNRGEFVSILGLSGSGKTTLVSMIGGLEASSSGQLLIDGLDTSKFKSKQWTDYRKNTIGFIFQDFNLIDHLSAAENIKIALSLSGKSDEEKQIQAEHLLRQVGMLEHKDHYPKELSGGQQQRIAIARALANNPEVILADEPTGALDPDTAVQILNLLKNLAKNGHLVIMVTHNKYLAKDYSSRIVELDDGQVKRDEIIYESQHKTEKPLEMTKSSLQLSAAFKIAYNNLMERKKSSILALVSLVPSIILVMILGNFIVNLLAYQDDIQPLYNHIVNEETLHFISQQSESTYNVKVKGQLVALDGGTYNPFNTESIESYLFAPYEEETLKELESLDFVEKVIAPNHYNVTINDKRVLLVGLLPEAYKQYQYDFDFGYYPKDHEQGLILSKSAIELLYSDDQYQNYIDRSIDFELTSYNGVPLHIQVYQDNRHQFSTKILHVFDDDSKTALMSSYYSGYIFAPYDYVESIRQNFTAADISLASFTVNSDVFSSNKDLYVFNGSQYLSDLLSPVRSRTRFGHDLDIFTFKSYPLQIPSSNYLSRHFLITKGPITEDQSIQLSKFGALYRSQFDEYAVDSAKETNLSINQLILGTKVAVAVIVVIPSVLVTLILYVSILLRTKEIGVLKSIGAKQKDIVTIFTLESGLLALVSGFIAAILSLPIISYARGILEQEYDISFHLGSNPLDTNWLAFISALVIFVLLTTLLGLLPGRKASKLQPRELLRSIN